MNRLKASLLAVCATMAAYAAPPSYPDGSTVADIVDGLPKVTVTINAPTKYDWSANYAPIPETVRMTIIMNRSCYGVEDEHQVATFTDVAPGQQIVWEDDDTESMVFGKSYSYKVKAVIGEEESSYGYLSAFVGVNPKSPVLTATCNGVPPVTLTVTTPNTNDQNDPLTVDLTKVVITRQLNWGDKEEIKVWENPGKGETLTFVDETAEQGNRYNYIAQAFCAYGQSYEASTTVLVDTDIPGNVDNKSIKVENQQTKAIITWKAPTVGANNGYIDPATLKYKVYRCVDGAEKKLVAENISALTAEDDLSDLTKEIFAYYQVIASNEKGSGGEYGGTSDKFIIGPMGGLPLIDKFNTKVNDWTWGANNIWASSSTEQYPTGGVVNSQYYDNFSKTINGVDKTDTSDDAFLCFVYNQYTSASGNEGRHDYMETSEVRIGNAKNIVAGFRYFCVPGSTSAVSLDYKPDTSEEWIAGPVYNISEGEAETWNRAQTNIGDLGDATCVKFRINAFSGTDMTTASAVAVDNVLIDDYPAVEAEFEVLSDGKVKLTWNDPSTESQKVDGFDVILDSETLAELEADELTYTTAAPVKAGVEHKYQVKAVYPGIDGPVSEVAVKVNKFTVEGVTYELNEADASKVAACGYPSDNVNAVIPATVEYADDTFTVTEIADHCFDNMAELKSVDIQANVTRIGDMAFWGCTSLASVTLPATVTEIGEGAFINCKALESIALPEALTTLGISAFQQSGLTEVAIPANVTVIPNYAFSDNVKLTKVTLPEGLTKIGFNAFNTCAMEEMTFPSTLTEIASMAFAGCASLKKGVFLPTVPPAVGDNAFYQIAEGAIGVCAEDSYTDYIAVENLKAFDFSGLSGVNAIDIENATDVRYFNLQGIEVVNPAEGYVYLVKMKNREGKEVIVKMMKR